MIERVRDYDLNCESLERNPMPLRRTSLGRKYIKQTRVGKERQIVQPGEYFVMSTSWMDVRQKKH
jgi:hypothetical protein